jgi:SH3-like domain-containing protein
MRLLPVLALAALAIGACSRSPPPAQPARPGAEQAGAEPSPKTPAGEAAAPMPKGPTAYVNAQAVLRREPTDAAKIPGKPGAKDVANYLATLNRGEKVAVLEARQDWARVRSSDDSEGWMKRSALLEQDGVTEATVLAPADVFDRPDLLAANAKRKVEAGTLVLVVKARPPFSEVNVSGIQDVWVLTDRLDTSEKEISVAKLIEKARTLLRAGRKDDALQLLSLARQHFEGATLIGTLATELGEPPPAPTDPAQPVPAGKIGDAASPADAGTQ